jgi:hypothetical protein
VVDRKAFRAGKRAVDQGHIYLQSKTAAEIVTADQLGNRTIKMLVRWTSHLMAIHMECAEMGELFRNGAVEAVQPRGAGADSL